MILRFLYNLEAECPKERVPQLTNELIIVRTHILELGYGLVTES